MAVRTGFKSKLFVNDGASQAYVVVAHTVSITLPERMVDVVETTSLDESDNYRKYIPSRLVGTSTMKFQVYYTTANMTRFTALLGKQWADVGSTVKTKFKCTPADPDATGALLGQVFEFDGFVSKLGELSMTKDATGLMFDVEVQQCSPFTITDATNEA